MTESIDEPWTPENAHRWWWGYRNPWGRIIAEQYTGRSEPITHARSDPRIGPALVVGAFMVREGEGFEQAEAYVTRVLESVPATSKESTMSDEPDTQCDAYSDGRCSLDAGHEGKHQTRTATGFLHTWANKFTLEADPIDDEPELDDGGIVCMDNAPEWFTGRWRDWHRGHACDKDDGKPRTPEGAAEIERGKRSRGRLRARARSTRRAERQRSPRRFADMPRICADAVRDVATGKPAKGVHAKACEREIGHEGPHRVGPHGELEHVVEWTDTARGWVSFNRKSQRARAAREASAAATSSPTTSTTSKAKPMTLPQNKKILGYRRHPAAAVWPMLEEDELAKLVESIKERGQLDDIVLVNVDGEKWILDGSNRGRACEIAGVKPRFSTYTGKKDIDSLLDYVDARNDRRRHTSKSVRAMIAAESAKLRHGERQTGSAAGVTTQAQAAKGKDVSERLVRKAVKVRDEATPRLKEAVMRGKLTVEAAEVATGLTHKQQDELADRALAKGGEEIRAGHVRSLARQEGKREIIRKINTGRVAPLPMGPFGVIYGDYPWRYENSDQHEGSRGHMGYPAMSMEEILAHAAEASKRAAPDCVIALWFTNLYMREIGRVVDAYGAEHHTVITWDKCTANDKDKAGTGSWPRGRTEHLVIASIGKPTHTLNEINTLIRAAVREHSRKPEEFADLLAKHCAGPFLEMFARDPRDGWTTWGAEPRKFEEAATEPKPRKSKILTATDARMGTSSP